MTNVFKYKASKASGYIILEMHCMSRKNDIFFSNVLSNRASLMGFLKLHTLEGNFLLQMNL